MSSVSVAAAVSVESARPAGRLPDFLIIGAAKSGTTTLFHYLSRHPQICVSRKKEPEFFADKFHRGWEWYVANFADARPGQVCGEASTIYTWWQEYPVCAARIGRYLPGARLIYILRHPVERTYSDYGEQIKTARALGQQRANLATFEDFLESYEHLVRAGEYIRYIEEYRRYFSRESLLILLLEDLQRDPGAVLGQVCRHLGVDESADLTAGGAVHANEARAYHQWQVRLHLTRKLRAIPGLERLVGMVVPPAWRERAYAFMERSSCAEAIRQRLVPPAMRPETRARLVERFREPNRRLAAYLGRDLSHWDR